MATTTEYLSLRLFYFNKTTNKAYETTAIIPATDYHLLLL